MGQDMILVCSRCKKKSRIGSFTYQKIELNKLWDFIWEHKYHPVHFCGDDGGGEIAISKLMRAEKKGG